jgi:hypothetical protein
MLSCLLEGGVAVRLCDRNVSVFLKIMSEIQAQSQYGYRKDCSVPCLDECQLQELLMLPASRIAVKKIFIALESIISYLVPVKLPYTYFRPQNLFLLEKLDMFLEV